MARATSSSSTGAVHETAIDGEPCEAHTATTIAELLARFADELQAGRVVRDEDRGGCRWEGYGDDANDDENDA